MRKAFVGARCDENRRTFESAAEAARRAGFDPSNPASMAEWERVRKLILAPAPFADPDESGMGGVRIATPARHRH